MTLTVQLPDGRSYPFLQHPLSALPQALAASGLRPGPCLLITDQHVAALYRTRTVEPLRAAGWTPTVLVLSPGESSKSEAVLSQIYERALGLSPSRSMPVLALGGGVVGDVAGFAAATLLRGLPVVQVPTTVIAQVDSAIGGKTGINHALGKNLIGAFHQPRLVLADPSVLGTLPDREYQSGLAEVVKSALIRDAGFLSWLSDSWGAILAQDGDAVAAMIARAAAIKARIVEEDEREAGTRMLLNFGHTFGHALERVTHYSVFTHGEAVVLGIRAALHLSASIKEGAPVDTLDAFPALKAADALVAQIPVAPPFPQQSLDLLLAAMQTDKKRTQDGLRFVVLDRPGSAFTTHSVPDGAVRAAWAYVRDLYS